MNNVFQKRGFNTGSAEAQRESPSLHGRDESTASHLNITFILLFFYSFFVDKLTYKAEWYGKTILRIGQFEPSSKLCNACGYHNKELTLAIREWTCPSCNTFHDRDINAAINIKKFSLQDQNLVVI